MSLTPLPTRNIISNTKGILEAVYQSWFNSIQVWLGPQGQSGPTTARPSSNVYIGLSYFDTTLGLPVFAKTVTPTAIPVIQTVVWVNGAGAVV